MIRRTGLLLLSIAVVAGLTNARPDNAQANAPLHIGNQLQLFVDDYLVESRDGVEFKLQTPQPAGKAIAFDKPWEGNVSAYVSVFRDGGKYRMYYRGASAPSYARKSALKPGETLLPEHPNFSCYAESRDGIVWTKPSLGITEFNGSGTTTSFSPERPPKILGPFSTATRTRPHRSAIRLSAAAAKD